MAVQDPQDQQQPPTHPQVQRLIDAAQVGAVVKASGAAVTAPSFAVTLPATAAKEILSVPAEALAHGVKIALILRILRALFRRRRIESVGALEKELRKRFPGLDDATLRRIIQQEAVYEDAFQRKATRRVEADLHAAGQLPTKEKQSERVKQIVNREKHYGVLRERAMWARAIQRGHNETVRLQSPLGAKWVLGAAKEHTLGCLALAGKNWPWAVLDTIPPPLHTNCQCSLQPLGPNDTVPPTGEAMAMARRAIALEEAIHAVADPGEIEACLTGLPVRPSIERALIELLEVTYKEGLHPRGRGGRWIAKLFDSPGFKRRREAHRVHDAFRRGQAELRDVVDTRAAAAKSFKRDFLAAMREARPGYGEGKVKIEAGSDPELAKVLQQAAEWFPKEWLDNAKPVRVVAATGAGVFYLRPEVARDHVPTIALREDSREGQIVHEMTHWLEDSNPEVHKAAQEFLDQRTEGVKVAPLVNGQPGEDVKEGGFVDPYMGKIYNHPSTEVLTMAMEGLAAGAVRIENDPEHFGMLLSLLSGEHVELPEAESFDTGDLKTTQAKNAAMTAARSIKEATGGDLVPMKITQLPEDDAATARSHRGNVIAVHEDSAPATQTSAIVHEYAHGIDRARDEDDWFTYTDDFKPLYDALMASAPVKALKADEVELMKGDERGRAQLLQGRELFARAFEQYVARRGNSEMLRERLRKLQNDRLLSFQYWQDDEFKPIAVEMEKALAKIYAELAAKPVQEATYTETLHPRSRLGRFMDKLGDRLEYREHHHAEASNESGKIIVGRKFLDLPEAHQDYVIAHELGHDIDDALLADPKTAWVWKDRSWADAHGDVLGGPQQTPGERIADAYAVAYTGEVGDARRWPAILHVAAEAKQRGLPIHPKIEAMLKDRPPVPTGPVREQRHIGVGRKATAAFTADDAAALPDDKVAAYKAILDHPGLSWSKDADTHREGDTLVVGGAFLDASPAQRREMTAKLQESVFTEGLHPRDRTGRWMFHLAPKGKREEIEKHGIDSTRGMPIVGKTPMKSRGNYLWDRPEAVQQMYAPSLHDIWAVDASDLDLKPDPEGIGAAVVTQQKIPAGSVRRISEKELRALQESVFTEWLHPRGRSGRWVEAIAHAEPVHEPSRHEGFTGEDFASALDGFEHGGIVAVRANRTQTQHLYADVWLNLQRPGGAAPVGLARVVLKPPNNQGRRVAEIENVYLKESEQNQGFGRAFTDHLFSTLRNGGVDDIALEAISVGGYSWARRGFVWTGDKAAAQREILQAAKDDGRWSRMQGHLPEGRYAELERKLLAGEFSSEAELAAYGINEPWWIEEEIPRRQDEDYVPPQRERTWLGKELMIGSRWKGSRPVETLAQDVR